LSHWIPLSSWYVVPPEEVDMNRLLSIIVVLVAILVPGCVNGRPATVRVLSYNIHHGEGMDGRLDLERIARVILGTEADLVALQEVDRGVERTDRVDQPARLAELTGMQAVFEKNIDYQGGEYGNAILSRLPVEFHENHYLPQSLPAEQRGLLEAHVRIGGGQLIFFATHFDYHGDDGERMASVSMLREMGAVRSNLPVVVAGDLNALPYSRVIADATDFMTDAFVEACESGLRAEAGKTVRHAEAIEAGFTFPADEPVRRIDYILHNGHPRLRTLECRVIPEPVASDHRPILAVLEIKPAR
jgi:endonuclease/exonuclease/phosphatase family metal-dependent hydrolase